MKKSKGLYSLFKTDQVMETDGIILDYGSTRLRIARAGGANSKFQKVLAAVTKPYKRILESLSEEQSAGLLMEAYAKAVVLSWEVQNDDGEFVSGIESESGEIIPDTIENRIATFHALRDFWKNVVEAASDAALFKEQLDEAIAKN